MVHTNWAFFMPFLNHFTDIGKLVTRKYRRLPIRQFFRSFGLNGFVCKRIWQPFFSAIFCTQNRMETKTVNSVFAEKRNLRADALAWLNSQNHFVSSITGENVTNRTLAGIINLILSFSILLIAAGSLESTPGSSPVSATFHYVFLFVALAWFAMSALLLKKGGRR